MKSHKHDKECQSPDQSMLHGKSQYMSCVGEATMHGHKSIVEQMQDASCVFHQLESKLLLDDKAKLEEKIDELVAKMMHLVDN